MQLLSDSFPPRGRIPAACAFGAAEGFGGNRNPHLAWTDAPSATQSFALLCEDHDAPTVAAMAGAPGVLIPLEQPRAIFVHWVMADIPATIRTIAEGSCSDGVVARGKQQPPGPPGARQGVNDYGAWFAGDAALAGEYYGYDGPWPPPNDLRLHRYFFRVFALDVATLVLPARFTAADLHHAMHGHVLAEAATWGGHSLHPGV